MATKTCFPEDLVEEILLRMPVKSILRCKSLSKHYYSLIHSQCFILRHLRHAKLNIKLFDRSFLSPVSGSVHLLEPGGHAKVLEKIPCIIEQTSNVNGHYPKIESICGPVDGLYCLIETHSASSKRCVAIWNPATREHFIPPFPQHNNYFGKKTSPEDLFIRAFGFGHDCNKKNYKVVIIYALISDMFDNKLYFSVFNLSDGEWRNYEECISLSPWNIESFAGVFTHGGCHWVCPPPLQGTVSGFTILAFDISKETHRTIPLPDTVIDVYVWFNSSIVTLNGCLALVNSEGADLERRCSCFNVWVMEEYGVIESWILMYRVSLAPGVVGRFLGLIGERFYVADQEGCLVSYDLRSKNDERYGMIHRNIRHILVPYEESLVRIVAS